MQLSKNLEINEVIFENIQIGYFDLWLNYNYPWKYFQIKLY